MSDQECREVMIFFIDWCIATYCEIAKKKSVANKLIKLPEIIVMNVRFFNHSRAKYE